MALMRPDKYFWYAALMQLLGTAQPRILARSTHRHTMPINCPALLSSAPPSDPALTAASVSKAQPQYRLAASALRTLPVPVIVPELKATCRSELSASSGFPAVIARDPTFTNEESASERNGRTRPAGIFMRSNADSVPLSVATISPVKVCPSENRIVIEAESRVNKLLAVTINPSGEITTPLPESIPLL